VGTSYELRPTDAVQMSREDARAMTDEVKYDAERLWLKLVDLYNGGAHKALGYRSWRAFCATEFQMDRNAAHRLLAAGQVMDDLWSGPRNGEASPKGDTRPPLPTSEKVLRELRPVHGQHGPARVREAWEQAVQEFGPKPTAAQVRDVVQREGAPPEPPKPTPSWVVRARTLAEELQDLANLGPDPEKVTGALALMNDVRSDLEQMERSEF
jgi:hypothetical protein